MSGLSLLGTILLVGGIFLWQQGKKTIGVLIALSGVGLAVWNFTKSKESTA